MKLYGRSYGRIPMAPGQPTPGWRWAGPACGVHLWCQAEISDEAPEDPRWPVAVRDWLVRPLGRPAVDLSQLAPDMTIGGLVRIAMALGYIPTFRLH